MEFTQKQRELMQTWVDGGLKRINLLEGSVSSGKTWISLVLWSAWVMTMPVSGLYLMCAKNLTTLKRNCLLLMQDLVGENNFTFSIQSKEGYLCGRRIIFEGANDARSEAKIRGLTLQGAYCDELTQLPEDFFSMLLSRLRMPGAKLIATTNPDAPGHWLKKKYIDRADELNFLDVKFALEDNTTLPAEYVENIKLEYVGVYYERFIKGLWVLAEGIIYPMYDQAIEEVPDTPAEDCRLSIDYGTMNAFAALLWERHGGVWYATREYYYSGRDKGITKTDQQYINDLNDFIRDIMEAREERYWKGETEYFIKMKTIIDPSAASMIALLRKYDWYIVIPADNAVSDGIRDTATAMLTGLIKISPSCVNLKEELQGYVWDSSATEDRPVKINDHACDALRYFVETMNLVIRSRARAAQR